LGWREVARRVFRDVLRDCQRRDVARILEAFGSYQNVGFSAPTGYGKTVVSLVAALELAETVGEVLIVVRTRNEISSFVRDCARFLGFVPSVFMNRARTCLRIKVEDDDLAVHSCERCPYEHLSESQIRRGLEVVKGFIRSGYFDPYYMAPALEARNVCPYSFWRSLSTPIVVATYPWLRFTPPEGYDFRAVVVDEAHNIESVALSSNRSVSEATLDQAYRSAVELGVLRRDIVRDVAEALKRDLADLSPDEGAKPFRETQLYHLLSDPFNREALNRACAEAIHAILDRGGRSIRMPPCLRLGLFAREAMWFARWVGEENAVLVKSGSLAEVRTTDLSVTSRLLSGFDKALLMSGTLPSKRYMERVWRLRSVAVIESSARVVGEIDAEIVPSVTTRYSDRSEEMWRRYAEIVDRAVERAGRIVLAVAPSYEIAQKIRSHLKHPAIHETRNTSLGKVEKLARSGEIDIIVAVANGKLVEGVELTQKGRSMIRAVVICGIPYPKKTQYLEMILSKLETQGISRWEWLREKAWIATRQALGRGARHPQDKCLWILADKRFLEPWWRTKISKIATPRTTSILNKSGFQG